jgi:hypothetical protein
MSETVKLNVGSIEEMGGRFVEVRAFGQKFTACVIGEGAFAPGSDLPHGIVSLDAIATCGHPASRRRR